MNNSELSMTLHESGASLGSTVDFLSGALAGVLSTFGLASVSLGMGLALHHLCR